eukprot:scaffold296_cov164-Ochromonas_danica.AAC.3
MGHSSFQPVLFVQKVSEDLRRGDRTSSYDLFRLSGRVCSYTRLCNTSKHNPQSGKAAFIVGINAPIIKRKICSKGDRDH